MSGLGNGLYTTGTAISTTGTGQITTISGLMESANNNNSTDMEDWDVQEMRKFIKWFVNMHHPEAVEQFLAIRKIERANEEQARLQAEEAYQKHIRDYWKASAQKAQNAYPYTQVTSQDTQQKSVWDRMKELAGYGPKQHGDYY